MRSLAAMTMLVLTVSGTGAAQEPAVEMTAHERAASELVDVLRLEQMAESSMKVMTESLLSQNPALAQLEDVILEFYREFMSWEVLRPEYVRIYAEAYTESEIRELIEFYGTPIGQKTIEQTPILMRKGAEIAQEKLQPHLPELQRRILARIGGGQ